MLKVKVTVPATSTNFGPGLRVVGLALTLRASVEMTARDDGLMQIYLNGDLNDVMPTSFDNPAVRAAIKVFQRFERAPSGFDLEIDSEIPWDAGLGAEAAIQLAAIVAANNLIQADLKREDIIEIARGLNIPPTSIIAGLFGALSICSENETQFVYHTLDIVPLKIVVVVPFLPDYQGDQIGFPKLVSLDEAIYNMGQTALMIEALRLGNFDLLRQSMGDLLHQPNYIGRIPAYEAVNAAALESGAIATIVSGKGPALLAIAENFHESIAESMVEAFAEHEIAADTFIVGVDRQGITVSIVEQ
ncbi:MAG: hypothetical protein CUN55_11060 [Phototrophicales bacterium]|nr:MAG: hypothetical protein CUN55_11060 [Phototrophicales bacterium]